VTADRRLKPLALDNLDDLLKPCRSCVFWELDLVAEHLARVTGDPELEKEAWVSATLLRWGSCGNLLYQDDAPRGYVLYAPPAFVPRSTSFPTSPISADSLQLITARVAPAYRGHGLGRVLVQAAARELSGRGARALEAFGNAQDDQPSCLLPAGFLTSVGFKTVRPHARYPRLRLDLRSIETLSAEVGAALDRIFEAVAPEPALRPV
jgi:GNAT superfamily N-acetyltransferase